MKQAVTQLDSMIVEWAVPDKIVMDSPVIIFHRMVVFECNRPSKFIELEEEMISVESEMCMFPQGNHASEAMAAQMTSLSLGCLLNTAKREEKGSQKQQSALEGEEWADMVLATGKASCLITEESVGEEISESLSQYLCK